jgi:putative transcriptional regulator
MNIEIPLDRILDERGRSFYWLAKETGISYTTLWRLKSGKALGINFATLEKICEALNCAPGDILTIRQNNTKGARRRVKTRPLVIDEQRK